MVRFPLFVATHHRALPDLTTVNRGKSIASWLRTLE